MRKLTICLCENKDADQCLCFRHTDSTITLLLYPKWVKLLAVVFDSIAQFVSDLIRNPNGWFSHAKAQVKCVTVGSSAVVMSNIHF